MPKTDQFSLAVDKVNFDYCAANATQFGGTVRFYFKYGCEDAILHQIGHESLTPMTKQQLEED